MALITDDFTTDPFAANWTNEAGTSVWDSGNGELSCPNGEGDIVVRRSAGGPGALVHEAQVTCTTAFDADVTGPTVRHANNGVEDLYSVKLAAGNFIFIRLNAGARTTLDVQTAPVTETNAHFYTLCLVAEGANGANVVLRVRVVDHGTSKPSDPGFLDMTTPDASFTDTDATRLDDDTLHLHCGIGSDDIGGSNVVDTRHDYWKARNLTDRVAARFFLLVHP